MFVVVPSLSIHPLRKYVKRRERENNVKREKRGHGRMSLKSFSLISVLMRSAFLRSSSITLPSIDGFP